MDRWNSSYPAPFFVDSFRCLAGLLEHIAPLAMPYWDDPNPTVLRQYLVMVGAEFELLCRREKFDAALIAGVALGTVPQEQLGYREMKRFADAVEALRVRRVEADKEAKNARLVYERRYGDKHQAGNIVEFPSKKG